MGQWQWGGMGPLPGVRTHVGDRALEPGFCDDWTRAPKKAQYKISTADGSSSVDVQPRVRSQARPCLLDSSGLGS